MSEQEPRYWLERNPKFIEFCDKLRKEFGIAILFKGSCGDFHRYELRCSRAETVDDIIIDYREELNHFYVFNLTRRIFGDKLIELCSAYEKPDYTSRDGIRYPIEKK